MAGTLISHDRNRWMAYGLTGLVGAMLLLAYAAVPLYQLFCAATGYGGTTRVAESNPRGVIARQLTVSFDSNVDNNLAWTVTPSRPLSGSIGKVETINFTATNTASHAVTGQAVFNVTPEAAGQYFNKIECFCFTKQTLQPGETVQMPVVYFVDPDFDKNKDLSTVKTITLSYTFYPAESEG